MIPNFRQSTKSTQVPMIMSGSSTFGIHPKISAERTYNMYLSDEWLVNFAGYKKVVQFPSGTIDPVTGTDIPITVGEGRGIFHSIRGNLMVVVINQKVFVLDSNLAIITLPTDLDTTTGEVFIDENLSQQICIVDGLNAYIYNWSLVPNLTKQTINAANLIPNFVVFHNTYFLFGNALTTANGNLWWAYERATDTTIQAVTGGAASSFSLQTKPDFALAVIRLPSQSDNVLVFGRAVCELWSAIGGLQNYRRISTINIDSGCVSISTIASSEDSVFWLGRTQNNAPVIMRFRNNSHEQISSDGWDIAFQNVVEPEKSTAAIYRQNGHIFYQLTFFGSSDNFTICYDLETNKFFDLTDQYLNYHPARETTYFNKKWYFVGINKPFLYEQSTKFFVIDESLGEDNTPADKFIWDMQYIRITNTIRNETTGRFRLNSISFPIQQGFDPQCTGSHASDYIVMEDDTTDIIETELGSPLITETSLGDFIDAQCPRIDLSFSKDGGYTWSNTYSKQLQPLAHRRNILTWNNLGVANEITCKFRIWTRAPVIINNGVAEVY